MGMAASQARYLALTARKNNTEYAGQQINQQRTTLSNTSATYNNEMLGLTVPTAPSVDSFTKITYSWQGLDGVKNTVNSITPKTDTTNGNNYYIDYSFPKTSAEAYTVKRDTTDGSSDETASIERTLVNTYTTKVSDGTTTTNWALTKTGDGTTQNPNKYTLIDPSNNGVYSAVKQTTGNDYDILDSNGTKIAGATLSATDLANSLNNPTPKTTYSLSEVTLNMMSDDNTTNQYTGADKTSKLATLRAQYATEHANDKPAIASPYKGNFLYYKDPKDATAAMQYFAVDDIAATSSWTSDTNNKSNADYDTENDNKTAPITTWRIGNNSTIANEPEKEVYIDRDSTGQMTSIKIGDHTYTLTTSTVQDEVAYNAATSAYEYQKAEYDQKINDIDAHISIVQSQDRTLEVKLKQLDTEQEALSTELDAVKKVIDKNIESSFKTFA